LAPPARGFPPQSGYLGKPPSSARTNPRYHALISGFFARTGGPILLNTSLNENGPVVRTPAEAISCFLRTDMDALVLGTQVIDRHAPDFPEHYRKRVDKD
jgi:carbamoyltransferase